MKKHWFKSPIFPFYEDYKLYALTDMTRPPPNMRYMLYKEGDASMLNWTNEPIYVVNEKAKIKLDRKTLPAYAKFFFHYVRGQLGRFIIVEKPKISYGFLKRTKKKKPT